MLSDIAPPGQEGCREATGWWFNIHLGNSRVSQLLNQTSAAHFFETVHFRLRHHCSHEREAVRPEAGGSEGADGIRHAVLSDRASARHDEFVKQAGAQMWIEHDPALETLKKSPQYYD